MPLYRVQVTLEAVVVSDDPRAAERIAMHMVQIEGYTKTAEAFEIRSRDDLPDLWTTNDIPYGSDDETIGGILKKL